MIGLNLVYAVAGAVFLAYAAISASDRSNPRRWGNAAFYALLTTSFWAGDLLGDIGNGLVVLGLVVVAGFKLIGKGGRSTTTQDERQAEAARRGSAWLQLHQSLFLHRKIGFDVHMRRCRVLMTEPQGDNGDVDARLKQVHCRCVSDRVGCDRTFKESRILATCSRNGEVQTLGNVRTGHATTTAVREQKAFSHGIADLAAPGSDERGSRPPERHAAFFAALATQMHGGLSFEHNVPTPNTDHLGNAGTRVVHHAEQGAVTLSGPAKPVRCFENGADLGP